MVATAHKNAGTHATLADWSDADRFDSDADRAAVGGSRQLKIQPVGVCAGGAHADTCGGDGCDCS